MAVFFFEQEDLDLLSSLSGPPGGGRPGGGRPLGGLGSIGSTKPPGGSTQLSRHGPLQKNRHLCPQPILQPPPPPPLFFDGDAELNVITGPSIPDGLEYGHGGGVMVRVTGG